MPTVTICLFGRLSVWVERQGPIGVETGKAQELLAYLLLHRDRVHHREALAALLWGENPGVQAKKYLRQALWHLQTALEIPAVPVAGRLLQVEPDWVQVNPQADLWLDIAVIEQAYRQIHDAPGAGLAPADKRLLEDATAIYRGELLEGCYQDWCLFERERLQRMYLLMLDKLMGYCEAHQEYETGLIHGAQILRYDRARERTHWRMMRLHYLSGDRTAALRQYDACVAALSEDLGVDPARRTVALCAHIRAGGAPPPAQSPARPTPPPAVPPTDLLANLRQVHSILATLQRQLQQEIQSLERLSHNRK